MSANSETLRQAGRALFHEGRVTRETARPLAIFVANLATYLLCQTIVATTSSVFVKTVVGVLAGLVTSTLFIIAHDCAHGAFVRSPLLNRILGTVAMMPGLHPYSLWERGHNQIHHRFTMQIGRDNAFSPLTPAQFHQLSWMRRLYYRYSRTSLGQLSFYFLEIWIPTMIFPVRREINPFKSAYFLDLCAITCFALTLVGTATKVSAAALNSDVTTAIIADAFLYNLAIPFAVWIVLISFLTVVQHTHPQARWRLADGSPSTMRDQADGTVHVQLPEWLDFMLHRVMHHHAHHLQPAIPIYHLKNAQKHLAGVSLSAAKPFLAVRWSLRAHFDTAARCKLYDIDHDCWRDFSGRKTGQPQRR